MKYLFLIIIFLCLCLCFCINKIFLESFSNNSSFKEFHIYVINLERSKDRRKFMESQLRNCPIPWTIINAIDGSKKLPKDTIPHNPTRPHKPGEIGAFLSHLKVFKTFIKNKSVSKAIVLEDDCNLPSKLWSYIVDICKENIPKRYDFIHLDKKSFKFYEIIGNDVESYFPELKNKILRPKEIVFDKTIKAIPELGMVAYCLNKKAANIFIDKLDTIIAPIDVQIHFPNIRKLIRWGKLKKNQIDHGSFKSTVQ